MDKLIESYVDRIEAPLVVMHEERMAVYRGESGMIDDDDMGEMAGQEPGLGAAILKRAKGALPSLSLERVYTAMPGAVRRTVSQADFERRVVFVGDVMATIIKFAAKRLKDAARYMPGVRISLRGITRLVITIYSRAVDSFGRLFSWEVDFEFDLMSRDVDIKIRLKVGNHFEVNVSDFKANLAEPSSVGKRLADTINAFTAPEKVFAAQQDNFRRGRDGYTF